MTTPLTTTRTEVLTIIQGKYFLQHPSPMKDGLNTIKKKPNYLFHHDNRYDTEERHTLKK
jgi:hypothetical protein